MLRGGNSREGGHGVGFHSTPCNIQDSILGIDVMSEVAGKFPTSIQESERRRRRETRIDCPGVDVTVREK